MIWSEEHALSVFRQISTHFATKSTPVIVHFGTHDPFSIKTDLNEVSALDSEMNQSVLAEKLSVYPAHSCMLIVFGSPAASSTRIVLWNQDKVNFNSAAVMSALSPVFNQVFKHAHAEEISSLDQL